MRNAPKRIHLSLSLFVITLFASATSAQTVIELRSGNPGAPGSGLDGLITMATGPDNAALPFPIPATTFTDAVAGSSAFSISPNNAWINALPSDPQARWISSASSGAVNNAPTALFAVPFDVPVGSIGSASLSIDFAVDNELGDIMQSGLFINGLPIAGTQYLAADAFAAAHTFSGLDISSEIVPGANTLYLYMHDTGVAAGMIFSAEVLVSPDSLCNGDGGDQMGCSDCPCGNNTTPGTLGGCLNSAGTASRLIQSGTTSVSAADLRFEASGVAPSNSCVLTSGNALAPANMANPCFGMSSGVQSVNLDGLRCVVQGVLRHGVRPSDANGDVGITTNGWGTPNGFFNFAAFVAGGTKHFQIIHRDDTAAVCTTGQNTSQAVSVVFGP